MWRNFYDPDLIIFFDFRIFSFQFLISKIMESFPLQIYEWGERRLVNNLSTHTYLL